MQAHNTHYIQPSSVSDIDDEDFTTRIISGLIYFSIKIRNIRRKGSAAPQSNWSPTVNADR